MKIMDITEVQLGPYIEPYETEVLYIEELDRMTRRVLPARLVEQLRWLNDQDGLESLSSFELKDNRETGRLNIVTGKQVLDERKPWFVTFLFRDKDVATLFKLTFGGVQ